MLCSLRYTDNCGFARAGGNMLWNKDSNTGKGVQVFIFRHTEHLISMGNHRNPQN